MKFNEASQINEIQYFFCVDTVEEYAIVLFDIIDWRLLAHLHTLGVS